MYVIPYILTCSCIHNICFYVVSWLLKYDDWFLIIARMFYKDTYKACFRALGPTVMPTKHMRLRNHFFNDAKEI